MIQFARVTEGIEVVHRGTDFNSALTCVMRVYDGSDVEISGSPFSMSAIGTSGLYKSVFTPTTAGTFKVTVSENGVPKAASSTLVGAYSLESLGIAIDGISTSPGYSDGGYMP